MNTFLAARALSKLLATAPGLVLREERQIKQLTAPNFQRMKYHIGTCWVS
jgi:hypothetical protein